MAGDEAWQVVWRHDVKLVAANERTEEFGILLHHNGGDIELALSDQLNLLRKRVMGQTNVEVTQIAVSQQLLHEMRGAGAFRAHPDRRSAQIRNGTKISPRFTQKQQGFRLGKLAQ